MRALIYLVLGIILAGLGVWWITVAGNTVGAILAGLVTALGAAFIITGWAVFTDIKNPTSKKL